MVFTSLIFVVFFVVVFFLYWFVCNKSLKLQNFLILASGYFFYGWWDWRFLFLLTLSATVDFVVGHYLGKTTQETKRKLILTISITFNIALLSFFKYFNFFAESFTSMMNQLGIHTDPVTLKVILPIGISFYTFQSLSYTIDVYKRRMEPTRDFLAFYAFISFFPQLVAGPIERAKNMIPQFIVPRHFDYEKAKDGFRQILWGFFKKIVIADTCGRVVDPIFANYQFENGSTLLLGVLLFTFQIYADFSSYSDIALGTARLLGFNLMRNFAYPNFSRDPGEYWRRWHISLSTWFRDYLYIPLGGNQGSKFRRSLNSLITFTVSGLWHGANWTYVTWGFLNGLYYVPLIIFNKVTKYKNVIAHNRILPSVREFFQMCTTFLIITLSRIFFRSPDMKTAIGYYKGILSKSFFTPISAQYLSIIALVFAFIFIEWINREKAHPLEGKFVKTHVIYRWAIYYSMIVLIFLFYKEVKSFIYFQF